MPKIHNLHVILRFVPLRDVSLDNHYIAQIGIAIKENKEFNRSTNEMLMEKATLYEISLL